MTTDTLSQNIQPFYQWDSIPYPVEATAPDAGIALGDTFSLFFLPDSGAVHDTVVRPSLFTGHELSVTHDTIQPRTDTTTPLWPFGILLALALLTTLYYRIRKLKFTNLMASLVDSRAMDRTLRESNLTSRIRYVSIGLLTVASLMMAVHQTAMAKTGIVGYLVMTAAVTAAYLLRNGLLRLLAVIFDNRAAIDSYTISNYLYHLALTTIILPLLLPLCYLPVGKDVLLYLLAGVVAVEFLMRLVRGMKLFLTQSSGPYIYLFYYLCIVEIVPILALLKWIIE